MSPKPLQITEAVRNDFSVFLDHTLSTIHVNTPILHPQISPQFQLYFNVLYRLIERLESKMMADLLLKKVRPYVFTVGEWNDVLCNLAQYRLNKLTENCADRNALLMLPGTIAAIANRDIAKSRQCCSEWEQYRRFSHEHHNPISETLCAVTIWLAVDDSFIMAEYKYADSFIGHIQYMYFKSYPERIMEEVFLTECLKEKNALLDILEKQRVLTNTALNKKD